MHLGSLAEIQQRWAKLPKRFRGGDGTAPEGDKRNGGHSKSAVESTHRLTALTVNCSSNQIDTLVSFWR